jgi:hypothetical protein
MGQVNMVEIKEAAEKGRDGKAKAAEKERGVNNGLMGILCRNSKPMANPPRTEFSRRKNPDRYEVEKFSFRNDGHVVTCERQLAVWVDWRNHHSRRARVFLLGAISILPASRVGGEWQRGFGSRKARTRARKAKAAKSAALMGYSRARYRFKKCPVSTQRTTWSSGSYFQKTDAPPHHSAIILKVARAARYHSALPLQC